MLRDALNTFSDAQALTATAVSTSHINLKAASQLGNGEPMAVIISVDVAADNTTGNETYQIDLECDDNTDFSTETVLIGRAIAATALTAGSIHTIPIPPELTVEQFARLNYTLGGTTPTVTLTAWVGPLKSVQATKIYPKNYIV